MRQGQKESSIIMRLSKAEKQILRAAISRASIEVRKSGAEHIDQALALVDGRLTPESLEKVQEHLLRALEHSRVAQPLLLARANALAIAAALACRATGKE
jgi:hypothetical protein